MTFSRGLFYSILSFIFGIGIASFFNFSSLFLIFLLILAAFLLFMPFSFKGQKQIVLCFCVVLLAFGIFRYNLAENNALNDKLKQLNNLNKEIILTGIVSKDVDVRETNSRIVLRVKEVEVEGQKIPIDSNILIVTEIYPEYEYGDKLKVIGILKTPEVFDDFNYREFLKKDRIYSIIRSPKIELLAKNEGSALMAFALKIKDRSRQIIYENMSPPESSILMATLLGDQRRLSAELVEKLSVTGVMHIVAISGAHITFLSAVLLNVFLFLGFWRRQAFYFTILIIMFYVLMIGFQPSAVRAAIMGGIFLLGQYFGRLSISIRLLVFAMALMLLNNPFLLKLDIGFQLSFLAMIGIIYLLPFLEKKFGFINNREIRMILAMTFAAYFFTLPIIVYNFGNISFIAPITNLLLAPISYWILISGLIFILIGFVFPFLAFWFSLPSWFLLSYFVFVVNRFFVLPLSHINMENISPFCLVLSYVLLVYITKKVQNKKGIVVESLYR